LNGLVRDISHSDSARRYILPMVTYTIIPGGGLYTISATSEDGTRRVVAAFSSEQVATDYLRRLQQKTEASDPLKPLH
jgi:hypothetical protein